MSLATYDDLITAIGEKWQDRTDLASVIPDFITLAEARFNRLESVSYERRDIIVLNAAVVSLPTDCKQVQELYFDDGTRRNVIELRSAGEIDPTRFGPLTAGVPTHAAVYANGSALLVSPSPDQSYSAWLVYQTKLAPLSSTNSTNWLLTDHPDIYLFGTLVAAEAYLKFDERFPLWKTQLDEALSELGDLAERRKYAANTPIQRGRGAIG